MYLYEYKKDIRKKFLTWKLQVEDKEQQDNFYILEKRWIEERKKTRF